MLEQFLKSIMANFNKIEPMNVYIQSMPNGVQYPCYLLNKVDITTDQINSYYFMNNVHLYVRMFGTDELELKTKSFNLVTSVFRTRGKVPLLNEDGTASDRFVRIEKVESIDIPVDENDVYCSEINFSFDTTHDVFVEEFQILGQANIGHSFI